MSHSEGYVLKIKASKKSDSESQRLYRLAVEKFQRALQSNPDNKNSLRNLADCYVHLDQYEEAKFYYLRAIAADPKDTNTLFKVFSFETESNLSSMPASWTNITNIMLRVSTLFDVQLIREEEYYLQSLEVDPYHSNCLCTYADYLAFQRNLLDEGMRSSRII